MSLSEPVIPSVMATKQTNNTATFNKPSIVADYLVQPETQPTEAKPSTPNTIPKDDNHQNNNPEWWQTEQPMLQDWPYLKARNDIPPWLEKLGYTKAVEVGVQTGRWAKRTLTHWPSCQEYKLMDGGRAARRVLRPWMDHGVAEFWQKDDAALLKNEYFDYIYLDAHQDYCGVQNDIETYWPKIRPGGILAGHDFIDAPSVKAILGEKEDWSRCDDGRVEPRAVRGAVEDFAQKHGLEIVTTHEGFDTWLIQKPYSKVVVGGAKWKDEAKLTEGQY